MSGSKTTRKRAKGWGIVLTMEMIELLQRLKTYAEVYGLVYRDSTRFKEIWSDIDAEDWIECGIIGVAFYELDGLSPQGVVFVKANGTVEALTKWSIDMMEDRIEDVTFCFLHWEAMFRPRLHAEN